MRFLLLLASTILGLTLSAFAGDCESTIQMQQEMRGGKNQSFIKNISEKPIVAYVVTNGTDASGNPVRSFMACSLPEIVFMRTLPWNSARCR
jgi:hypothetical protein